MFANRIGKALTLLTMVPTLVAGCGPQTGAPRNALDELVGSERAFARASADRGIREAFLEFMASDAIVFRPQPVNAQQWYRSRPEISATLTWEPEHAEISAGGDFGYTSGPWELRQPGGDESRVVHGHYVSLWSRGPEGEWKVVLDVGTQHAPQPANPFVTGTGERLEGRARGTRPATGPPRVETVRDSLVAADLALAEACASRGVIPAYREWSAVDVRLYRMNRLPAIGSDSIAATLTAPEEHWTRHTLGARGAPDGDLGYTYGRVEPGGAESGAGAGRAGYYVRIWSRRDDSGWKLIVDVLLAPA